MNTVILVNLAELVERFAQEELTEAKKSEQERDPARYARNMADAENVLRVESRFLAGQRERFGKIASALTDREAMAKLFRVGQFDPSNKRSREFFTSATGVVLPKTVGGTDTVLREYIGAEYLDQLETDRKAEKQAEADAKEAARVASEQARIAEFDGYGADMKPGLRAKAYNTLETSIRSDGVVVTRKELVRRKLDAGYTVQTHSHWGRIITSADHVFLTEKDITKTAMDYAEYLIAKRCPVAC